jgi:hypothetical protein
MLLATGGLVVQPVSSVHAKPLPVEAGLSIESAHLAAPPPLFMAPAARKAAVPANNVQQKNTKDPWAPYIAEAHQRFGIPQDWIRDVIQVESSGRAKVNGKPIVSKAGAMGLMQLMPDTYTKMQRAHGLGSDPHDSRDNILAGTAYLRALHDCFGWPAMYAAYNVGPKRLDDLRRANRNLPRETQHFLDKLGVAFEETAKKKRLKAAAVLAVSAASEAVTTQYAYLGGQEDENYAETLGLTACPLQDSAASNAASNAERG